MSLEATLGPGFGSLPPRQKLERAATELEAVVLAQLFSAMRATVPEGGLFEESSSNTIFRSMLDEELARKMAAKSPFGLAEAVVKQFEAAAGAAATRATTPEPFAPSFRRVG